MKTQSLKSVAAGIVAAGMLSSTMFAGPGPRGAPVEVRGQTTQTVVTTRTVVAPKVTTSDFKTTKSTTQTPRSARLVYNAHGGVNVL